MTAPILRRLTEDEATSELRALEASVGGSLEDFEERAHAYELNDEEAGLWERISELRWLIQK